MPLFLASESPRRVAILKKHKIPFIKIKNNLDESTIIMDPENIELSLKKLVQEKAKSVNPKPKGWILTADTIIHFKNQFLGKPKNLEEAENMLESLSDNTHTVWTACYLWETESNKTKLIIDKTDITFKELSKNEIKDYINNYQVLDKAGSYALQDIGEKFITSIKGEADTVIGLPITKVKECLKKYAILSGDKS